MSTRKTLKDFFRSQGSVQNSISINPTDSNGNSEIDEGDDIGPDVESGQQLLDLDDTTTGMLGDYVNFLMSSYDHQNGTFNGTVANFYRPGPRNTRAPNSNRGNRTHSPLGADGSNKVFADENSVLGKTLVRYSNSSYISNLDSIVKKEGDPLNNNLLAFETEQSTNTGATFTNREINEDAVRETLNTFQGYNRYYPSKNSGDGSAYAEKNIATSESVDSNSQKMYNTLGSSETSLPDIRINNIFNLVPDLLEEYTGIKKNDLTNKTLLEIEEFIFNNENNSSLTSKNLRSNKQNSLPEDIKNDGFQERKGDVILDERSSKVEKGDYSDFLNENPEYIIYLGSVRMMIVVQLIIDYFEENNIPNKKTTGYINRIRGTSQTPGIIDTTYNYQECLEEGLSILFLNKDGALKRNKFEDVISSTQISDSKYFWVAMFKSIIKESDRLLNTIENSSSKVFLRQFEKSRIAQFSNMVARIGDIALFKTNGEGITFQSEEPFRTSTIDIDNMPKNIFNIRSKNKTKDGELAWKQGSTPSLYMMPGNINRAAISLGSGLKGTNPIKSVLAQGLSDQTFITPAEGDFAKIPSSLVEKLENDLEASYVPFYFHDLRTNEIISFHAFLNQLTDSFNPGYNGITGYGRMDPVQLYKGTSRNINVGFTIAATSKKDFNEMWWKINKLLTLLYPQWSKGTKVFDDVTYSMFTQPFSQIIEASPMIRLRVGDVIKSNYSELASARKFGIGNVDTFINGRPGISFGKVVDGTLLAASIATRVVNEVKNVGIMSLFGSPIGNIQLGIDATEFILRSANSKVADAVATLRNTRAGKFGEKFAYNSSNLTNEKGEALFKKFKNPNVYKEDDGPKREDKVIVAATMPDFPYWSPTDNRYFHLKTCLIAKIIKREKIDNVIYWVARIVDIDAPENIIGKEILLRFDDFILSPEHMFLDFLKEKEFITDFLVSNSDEVDEEKSVKMREAGFTEDELDVYKSLLAESVFMSPYASELGTIASAVTGGETPTGNPVTRAFNSTKGRGLAGFINSFSIDLVPEDGTWETDYNSRAPKLVKVTFGFAPVHDITPGIDHSGFNTAPIYNVGDIMKETSGDPWASKGSLGARSFKQQGISND